jgi:transcriptional regulator with XRE-family HTH domain
MSSINEQLGKNVKKMREYRELTQQELADKAGLSKVTIGQIERGNAEPSIGTLGKIAQALECELAIDFLPSQTNRDWGYGVPMQ